MENPADAAVETNAHRVPGFVCIPNMNSSKQQVRRKRSGTGAFPLLRPSASRSGPVETVGNPEWAQKQGLLRSLISAPMAPVPREGTSLERFSKRKLI